MPPTTSHDCRLLATLESLDLAASEQDVIEALQNAGIPDTEFRWLRDGAGRPPPASVLLGIYEGLTDSRKGDLLECAQVIALAP